MLKNKKLSFIISSILVLGVLATGCSTKKASAPAEQKQQVIRVGSSGGYYPFTFMENDKLQGFEIDVWNEIGKRENFKIEFVTASFSGLFGMLDTDKIDTISNQITITEQRKAKYLFATPYVYDGAQLVVKKGNDSIKSFADLKGKTMAVDLGTNYEQLARGLDKNNEVNIKTYQGAGVYQDLVLGRVDALMIDRVSALATIQKQNLELQLAGDPVEKIENAFPFVNNEKNKAIVEKVNKAIEDMRADGTLKKISNKWVKADITKTK